MKRLLLALLMASFFTSGVAKGQWGAGVWGGNQGCPYEYGAGEGSIDDDDGIQNLKRMRAQKKREYDRKAKKQADLRRRKKNFEKDIRKVLKSEAASAVIEHMDDRERNADSYALQCSPGNVTGGGSSGLPRYMIGGGSRAIGRNGPGGAAYPSKNIFCIPVEDAQEACQRVGEAGPSCSINWWPDYAQDGGAVDPEVCNSPFIKNSATAEHKMDCKAAIQDYYDVSEQFNELAAELAAMKQDLREFERTLDSERERIQSSIGEGEDGSEAYCPECESRRRGRVRSPTTLETIGSIGMSVLGGVLAYKGAKYAIDQNSRLGWPTQPYAAAAMGYPFLMNGLYGAIGGGIGGGAFACAGGAGGGGYGMGPYGMNGGMGLYGGMGGAFGYPMGMMGLGFGGGLYMPGMGPWGMGGGMMGGMMGMMGNMGMMGGMMGMMGNMGMMGGMMGMMGNMGMMGGGMMGMMGMMGNMGMMGGAMGMMGGMMGMMGNMGMMGGAMGMMGNMGMMGGGMMGMMGMMGNMGMMGGAMGMMGNMGMMGGAMGMMGNMGMMGGSMGMMGNMGMMGGSMGMMGNMGMMGGAMGMMGNMGMMGGAMGMMGGAMGMMGGMDMGIYMAQQQQAQQDAMMRMQTVQRLQVELYQIQMQMQQIMYGGYGSSSYGGSGTTSGGSSLPSTGTPSTNPRGGNTR
jgi:hypothetical protein